jgi:hypothetical protein
MPHNAARGAPAALIEPMTQLTKADLSHTWSNVGFLGPSRHPSYQYTA